MSEAVRDVFGMLGGLAPEEPLKDPAPARSEAAPEGKQTGNPEIKVMLAEVDLLGYVQRDTGEQGRRSGNRVDFHNCPICGNHDCFRVYPTTNSWSCFSASNATGYTGGTLLEYLKARHGYGDREAVNELRRITGRPRKPASVEERQADRKHEGDTLLLPPWVPIEAVNPPSRNPVLVDGLLRRGHVALLAAKGKAGKSWAAIQLSCAVATGGLWFGRACERGDVLYIDPEIDRKSLDNRFAKACGALEIDPRAADAHVHKWPLRGVEGADMASILHDLRLAGDAARFALVVIDSASVFVEGDENSSVDVRAFSRRVLDVAEATGASVLLVHHFGKGAAGDREAADRARGSSVWLDFPDVVLTLTEVFPPSGEPSDYLGEGERAFVLETGGMREFAIPEPSRFIFSYPIHRADAEGVTEGWKPTSGRQSSGKASGEAKKVKSEIRRLRCESALAAAFIAQGVGRDGITASEAAKVVSEALDENVKASTLKGYIEDSEVFRVDQTSMQRWRVVPINPPAEPQPELEVGG